jgi:hypothetical protein
VQFTTGPLRRLPVKSGTYDVVICTDIYGRIQRFARNTNCSLDGKVAISTAGLPKTSRSVPDTIIGPDVASVSRNSTRAFRFVSTVTHSTFQCRLDGAPWLACRSPQRYVALANGRHAFEVRAVSPAGDEDPSPAHASWTVNAVPPAVTTTSPGSGGTANNNEPQLSGAAGTAPGDSSTTATPPPSSYSIGGTVSGLSGTLVLQDDRGGALTVSTNGPFTFVRPIADGAPYDVTVKTDPDGQTCSIAGAAGNVASADVTTITVTCTNTTPPPTSTPREDDFNRADGGLGAGWAAMTDGGLSIVSHAVVGPAGALAGDIRTGESYGSDQYSQLEVTSTSLPVGDWVGPAVRSQNGGQDAYLGLYWNDQVSGSYELQLYVRKGGSWI